jgi:hypothetical protein
MKEGKYFRIPEGPADLERLWLEAEPLMVSRLPDWLTPEDVNDYRYLGYASWPAPDGPGHDVYCAEMEELEEAGLITDDASGERGVRRFYMAAPKKDPVWSIGIYVGQSPLSLAASDSIQNPVLTHEHVSDISATFIADPFMIPVDGRWFMFFEAMNWRRNLGEIGLATSEDAIHWKYQQIVLAEPFHLSYPYVFEWKGDYYMIPESYQAHSVRLYKAREFPTQWSVVAILLEGPYFADASVFRAGGKWWIFTDASADMGHDTLRLFLADDLTGPWIEHPQSPLIKGNPHIARPAGRVLVGNGRIIRFTQCCLPYYGTAVRAFEVTELTPARYREKEVGPNPLFGPSGSGWNACGMHHVDAHQSKDGRWIACVDGWIHDEVLEASRAESA